MTCTTASLPDQVTIVALNIGSDDLHIRRKILISRHALPYRAALYPRQYPQPPVFSRFAPLNHVQNGPERRSQRRRYPPLTLYQYSRTTWIVLSHNLEPLPIRPTASELTPGAIGRRLHRYLMAFFDLRARHQIGLWRHRPLRNVPGKKYLQFTTGTTWLPLTL